MKKFCLEKKGFGNKLKKPSLLYMLEDKTCPFKWMLSEWFSMKLNKTDIILLLLLLFISGACLSLVYIDKLYFRLAYNFNDLKNPIAELQNVAGDIRVKPPDFYQWIPAQANMKLGPGFQIFSGDASSVDVEAENWSAHVEEKSYLYLDNLDNLNRVSVDGGQFKFRSKANDVVLKICDENLNLESQQGDTQLSAESSCLEKPKVKVIKGRIKNTKKVEVKIEPQAQANQTAPLAPERDERQEQAAELERFKTELIRKKKPELIKPRQNEIFQFLLDEEGRFLSKESLDLVYTVNMQTIELAVPAKNFLNASDFVITNNEIQIQFQKQIEDNTWSVELSNKSVANFIDLKSDTKRIKVLFNIQKSISPVRPTLDKIVLDRGNYLNQVLDWQKDSEHQSYIVQFSRTENFEVFFKSLVVKENSVRLTPFYKDFYARIWAATSDGRRSPASEVVHIHVDLGEIDLDNNKDFLIKNNETTVDLKFELLRDIKHYGVQISKTENFDEGSVLKTRAQSGNISFKYPSEGSYFWRVWPVNTENLSLSSKVKIGKFNIIKVRKSNPPVLISPLNKSTQYFQNGKEIFTHLKWNDLSGAEEYEIQLAEDEQFLKLIEIVKSKSNNKIVYFKQFYNKVYWRVRGIGKSINQSDWSETRTMFFYKE